MYGTICRRTKRRRGRRRSRTSTGWAWTWYVVCLTQSLPAQPAATTPLEAAKNGLSFYQHLQSSDGHFAGEYGGPMFLLPGLAIGMYVTETPIPDAWRVEIARYLWHRQHPKDGGWGIHIEGPSTVFGTALNYVVLRLVGVPAAHPMMVRARACLHKLGGATGIPSWGKLWLAILNVYDWDGLNPIPPELWLLPDWVPIHPWRWWVHTRMVYLPMGYLYGARFRAPLTPLLSELRAELYVEPYESIDWPRQRNHVAQVDLYAPHTRVVDALFSALGVYESWAPSAVRTRGMKKAYELVVKEDENTSYQCLGPVNKMLNMVVRYAVDGVGSGALARHREKVKDFAWMGAEGLMMTGTNGSQLWDTSFLAQAACEARLASTPAFRPLCERVLAWLDACQIRENPRYYRTAYRFATKGAWPFSTAEQGYTVSDCTAEGLKAVLMLQEESGLPPRVSRERMHDTIDLLLSMQNPGGGYASYETINGPALTEWLNPAEVFGNIMVEYAYPECTTSVVTALRMFQRYSDYRSADIDATVARAVRYILRVQRADGSWYGSWAICFTYAAMFALESLHHAGLTYENSEPVRRACGFLLAHQAADGGWGESYLSCETHEYVASPSQVVQTSWAILALLHARFPDKDVIRRAVGLLMRRQRADGSWAQEQIEGIFNQYVVLLTQQLRHLVPELQVQLHHLGARQGRRLSRLVVPPPMLGSGAARSVRRGVPSVQAVAQRLCARHDRETSVRESRWMLEAARARHGASPTLAATLDAWVRRRLDDEPLSYILGDQPFGPLQLRVRPPVLIPRAETEAWSMHVAALLAPDAARAAADGRPWRVLDLCTGSGCVGVLLAHAWRAHRVHVTAADVDADARALAAENAHACGVAAHMSVVAADMLQDASVARLGVYDVVVLNPPYIDEASYETLDKSVRGYEARAALVGMGANPDGLAYYRALARHLAAGRLLAGTSTAPRLFAEIGAGQGAAVAALLAPLGHAAVWPDDAARDRVVAFTRPSSSSTRR